MRRLPYRARTASGDTLDIDFPLHAETGDPVRLGQLVSAVLAAVDRDIAIAGHPSNGDVLTAVAMALAIRAGMIHASPEVTGRLAHDLLRSALAAVADADRRSPPAGHA